MIPKQDNSGSPNAGFNNMINDMRKEFSRSGSIGELKQTFMKSSDAIVGELDTLIDTENQNTLKILQNLTGNFNDAVQSLGVHGTQRLVGINQGIMGQNHSSIELLKQIRTNSGLFGGRSGLIGTLKAWAISFKPFTNERRAKFRVRQQAALNKLARLTWIEQQLTRIAAEKSVRKSSEEEQEKRRWWSDLFGKRDRLTRSDLRALHPRTFQAQMLRLMGVVLGGSVAALVTIAGSFLARGKILASIVSAIRYQALNAITSPGISGKIIGYVLDIFKTFGTKFKKMMTSGRLAKGMAKNLTFLIGGMTDLLSMVKTPALMSFVKEIKRSNAFVPVFKAIGGFLKNIGGRGFNLVKLVAMSKPVLAALKPIIRIASQGLKFVPILNFVVAAYEGIRGIMKGIDKIGGIKGAITGLFGGVLEFFTLGIFDMEVFLNKAKGAFMQFENGNFMKGLWELVKAPFAGMESGVKWLTEKLFGGKHGGIFKPGPESGMLGKVAYMMLAPWKMIFGAVKWIATKIPWQSMLDNLMISLLWVNDNVIPVVGKVVDFLYRSFIFTEEQLGKVGGLLESGFDTAVTIVTKIKNFFISMGEIFGSIIDRPIETIRQLINGTYESRSTQMTKLNNRVENLRASGNIGGFEARVQRLMQGGMGLEEARRKITEQTLAENARRKQEYQAAANTGPMPQQNNPTTIVMGSDTNYRSTEHEFAQENAGWNR